MPLKILPSQTMLPYRLVHLYEDDYIYREDNVNTDSDPHENNMKNIPH